jgi:predicted DNA-binding protein (UPF0251 family)
MSDLPTKKQLRAYFLVEVMGETQVEAARIMDVSRQAIRRLLKRFYAICKKRGKTKKQLQAYFLCEVMGKTQAEAAKIMGVCTSAVTNLLTRFYKNAEAVNKGKATKTISLPGDFEDRVKDIF